MEAISKPINGCIGLAGSFVGFILFVVGGVLGVGILSKDVAQALIANIPIVTDLFDWVIIATLVILGGFCMGWGSAMLRRKEWGAVAGGLVQLTLAIYLMVAAYIFLQDPSLLFQGAGRMSFYKRYEWLLWSLYGLLLLWLLGTTAVLFTPGRRDFYARAYQDNPPPKLATCDKCGLILNQDRSGNRSCRECNRAERNAHLIIGQSKRRALLEFIDTPEGAAKIIGRQKNNSEADLTISTVDAQHLNRISGRHIVIRYHFDYEQFTIEDLSTTNKTYLNGQMLPSHDPRRLDHGDMINLAKEVEMVFECQESAG